MGGDHKCPLCSATFTRPQHVGRHLRAHTGDRPYECKECPLRFARSDLLSRHVNKAHRAQEDGGAPKKEGKKGRRKSEAGSMANGDESEIDATGRRASMDQSSFQAAPIQNGQAQLQASKLYPHHPLLSNDPQTRQLPTWNGMDPSFPQHTYPANMSMQAYPGYPSTFSNLFTATPMRPAGSEQSMGNGNFSRSPPMNPWAGYDFGFKKKACDQCNHSKVRCDFADPCARCSHRNIMCTYNKPSKSRSIAQAMPFGNRMGIFDSSPNASNSSTSPQSQLSNSPMNKSQSPSSLPMSTPQQRRQSLSSNFVGTGATATAMPAWNASYPGTAPMGSGIMSQPMWTQSMSDLNAMIDPHLMAPPIAQPMPVTATPSMPMEAYARGATSVYAHTGPLGAGAPPVPMPSLLPQGLSGSPSITLAPTPALTNDSRSPSGASEPSERRSSRNNGIERVEPMTAMARKPSIATDQVTGMPMSYSPVSASASTSARNSLDVAGVQPTLTADGNMVWPPVPMMTMADPRMQYRGSMAATDDGSVSGVESSAASVFGDVMNPLAARRFSTGAWASAFNNMSLQDANGNTTSISVNALTDPLSAGRVMQTLSARRPTFPLTLQASDGTATKIPSMADVKDLWKLFMAEPITGPTPTVEKSNPVGSAMVTPRPGLGKRTLSSRRNSLPDLNSPNSGQHINNFFVHSGITPRPMQDANGYMPPHLPLDQTPPRPDASIRKWKEEINQRQRAFTMQPSLKFGGKVGSPEANMPPPHSMDYAAMSSAPGVPANRPIASVLQLNPNLYQTLAPERAPSYGLGSTWEGTSPAYLGPSVVTSKYTSNLAGPAITSHSNLGAHATETAMPSLVARPGNKRLASQTLVHEKKGSFSMYDDGFAEDDSGVEVMPGMDPGIMAWGGVAGVPLQSAP